MLDDPKIVCTFKIYINEWNLSLLACLKRGKKPGSEFITPFSKSFEGNNIGEIVWTSHWEFDREAMGRFIPKVKEMLKAEMGRTTQDYIPM